MLHNICINQFLQQLTNLLFLHCYSLPLCTSTVQLSHRTFRLQFQADRNCRTCSWGIRKSQSCTRCSSVQRSLLCRCIGWSSPSNSYSQTLVHRSRILNKKLINHLFSLLKSYHGIQQWHSCILESKFHRKCLRTLFCKDIDHLPAGTFLPPFHWRCSHTACIRVVRSSLWHNDHSLRLRTGAKSFLGWIISKRIGSKN